MKQLADKQLLLFLRQKATPLASAMDGLVNAAESNRTFDIVTPAYQISSKDLSSNTQ